jgi:uncharacterized protein YukE
MAVISVTPEELKTQAQVYLRAKEEIDQAVQKVNSMNSINEQLNKYADTVQDRDTQDAQSFGF